MTVVKHDPLRVHPKNPHYFLYHGAPTILITSAEHYGAVVNLDFDYVPYLERLASCRLNYTRIYPGGLIEREGDFVAGNTLGLRPGRFVLPWARSSTPGYPLGGNTFDLDRWDDAYFARLDDFLTQAGNRDVVVEICFFNAQYPKNWEIQALFHNNNIQDVGHCGYVEVQTLRDGPLVARQEAYVARIVQDARRHDNVIFEICDEPQLYGTPEAEYEAWISRLIDCVRRSDDPAAPHLVAQQMDCDIGGPGDFSADERVGVIVAQYIRLAAQKQHGGMRLLETEYAHEKPIELNETAYYPAWYTGDREAASRVEAWEFIVGGGAGFNQLNGMFTVHDPAGRDRNNDKVLAALTSLRAFMESFEILSMRRDGKALAAGVPDDAHAQCLSEPGQQYALYIHHSVLREVVYVTRPGTWQEVLQLDIPTGTYAAEWVSPEHGLVVARETLTHNAGKAVLVTPLYAVDIALRLKRVTPKPA